MAVLDICEQFSEGGKLVTYSGVVVSQVPGFIEWYNMMTNLKLYLPTNYKMIWKMGI